MKEFPFHQVGLYRRVSTGEAHPRHRQGCYSSKASPQQMFQSQKKKTRTRRGSTSIYIETKTAGDTIGKKKRKALAVEKKRKQPGLPFWYINTFTNESAEGAYTFLLGFPLPQYFCQHLVAKRKQQVDFVCIYISI